MHTDPLSASLYWFIPDFFKPAQFYLQPPDLGVEVLQAGGWVSRLGTSFGVEQAPSLLLQLFLPQPDLRWMYSKFLGNFVYRLAPSSTFFHLLENNASLNGWTK